MKQVLFILFLSITSLLSINLNAQTDTIQVMYYNLLNFPGTTWNRVQYVRETMQYTQPDLLLVNELQSQAAADSILIKCLNINGITKYGRAVFVDGPDTDNMLFYNKNKFKLKAQYEVHTALRDINEYLIYYNGTNTANPTDTIFLRLFSAHLKASSGSDNEILRLAEVQRFQSYINTLPKAENIFIGGDFNFYDTEAAYTELTTKSNFPLVDVVGAAKWTVNASYAKQHTQSTRTTSFGGGATGGMDDRFDFILFSKDVQTGTNGVKYLTDSYKPFGNDGNHFNLSIVSLPTNPFIPAKVINALHETSDHLPITSKFVISANTQTTSNQNNISIAGNKITIFPNPTSGIVNVQTFLNNPEQLNIYVYNQSGIPVHHQLTEKQNGHVLLLLDLNQIGLSAGVYYLKIVSETINQSSRFIIIK